MMKKLVALWLLVSISCLAYSQIITVTDSETGEPLEMVTLTSDNPKASATTNAQGQANIAAFKDAAFIELKLLGYETVLRSYAELAAANFKLTLTQASFNMDGLVISNTRWQQNSSDIPTKIATISKKDIALQNPQTAADLLAMSGQVFIQKSQQGGGSPMIRGFATNRLLYTVDGIRMNSAIFRGGNVQNVISLDPFSMESAEVLFGPGSIIYGSDAIGGVMAFRTLHPQFSLTDTVLVTGSAATRTSTANNELTGHFDVNIGLKKWAFVTSISSNKYGDLRMGTNGPDEYLRQNYIQRQDSVDRVITNNDPLVQTPSGYSQINMLQKIGFQLNEKWDFTYSFHYSETSDYARYDRHLRTRKGLPRYGEWNYGPQKWMMNNIAIDYTANNKLFTQMSVRLAQQSFEESRISRDFNKDAREIRTEEVEAYSVNIDFNKHISDRNTLFYGAEMVTNDVTSTGIDQNIVTGTEATGASRYPQSTWSSYAAYINDQYKISPKVLMQAGVRFNQFNIDAQFDTTFYPFPYTEAKTNRSAVTGSLGFVYRPNDKWMISTNGATAFRSPNIDDMGKVFDSEAGSVIVPNPNLEAEYAYNADVDIARIFGDKVKVDATAYYTVLNNALVRRNFTLNGMDSILYDGTLSQVQAIQNAAVTTVYGIQAGIEIKLAKGFSFSTNFNYQKGEEELDDATKSPSRHAAPWYGKSALTYNTKQLHLQLYGMYSDGKTFDEMPEEEKGKTEIYAIDENGNPYSPGWYTLNFKANYKISNNWLIGSGLENITNQRYRPFSSGIVAPGRNFILSLKATF